MHYSTSQAASMADITAYTLHCYDKEGLLPRVNRDSNGFRYFTGSDIAQFRIIGCLRASGISIKELKAFTDWHIEIEGDTTLRERYDLFLERRKTVMGHINELQKILEKIDFQCWYYKTTMDAGTLDVHKKNAGYDPSGYKNQHPARKGVQKILNPYADKNTDY